MLEGTLDDFALPDIFRLLALTGKTGCLEIIAAERRGRVVFDGGDVTAANADVRRAAFARRLLGAGLATPAQVRAAAERGAGPDGLGPDLVEAGVVDADALEALVREQVSDAVFDLMRWERGTFRFVAGRAAGIVAGPAPGRATADGPRAPFEVEPLVAEVAGRLEEWERLRQRAPVSDAVVAMAAVTGDGSEHISLRPDEWRLLTLVDGRRTVAELVELSGQGEFATVRLLEGMVRGGLLEVFEPGAGDPPPPPVSERLALLDELESGSSGEDAPGSSGEDAPRSSGEDAPVSRAGVPHAPSRIPAAGNGRAPAAGHVAPAAGESAPREGGNEVLTTDPAIDADLVRRLIDGVRGL